MSEKISPLSIIALLLGGLIGTFTSLSTLIVIGVGWSTGVSIYFATAAFVALPIIAVGTYNRRKTERAPPLEKSSA